MGPRGEDYRAGETDDLSSDGDKEKKRFAGEPRSVFLGEECKKPRAGMPEHLLSDGEKKPHKGEAVFAGGVDKKRRGVEADRPHGEGKKRRGAEARSLLPGGEGEKYREPVHPSWDGGKKKLHSHKGETAVMFPGGEAEGKNHHGAEARSLLPGGEGEKYREPVHPSWDGGKKNLHSHKGETAVLFPGGEAEGKNHHGAEARSLLPGGEGEKYREPVPPSWDGDKKEPRNKKSEATPLLPGGEAEAEDKTCRTSRSEETWAPPALMRTPALIAEALQLNGPPPRRHLGSDSDDDEEDPVALALYWRGVERQDRYDPYVDYFFIGRPQAEAWCKVWRDTPLQLHDAGLVAAVDSIFMWGPGLTRARYLDVSHHVTRVLESHPGPVSTLRIDASEFPGPHHLERWMSLLSLKQAETVILVNMTAPVENAELPLHQLCSRGLTYLGVGFINLRTCLHMAFLSAGENGHPWSTLRHLNLTACLFGGPQLEQTVKDLWGLTALRINHCDLTQGCEEETGLHIESPRLISLVFSSCTATRKLVLGRAPWMKTLQLGVRPAVSSAPGTLPIHIHFCERLYELRGLSLSCQDITLWSSYTTKVNRKTVLSFRCLKTLVTTVNIATTSGTEALLCFLAMVPHLKKLTVLSAHVHSQDGGDAQEFLSLDSPAPGIMESLQHLTMSHFMGTKGETAFIVAILATAQKLLSVAVHPDDAMSVHLREVAKFLKERPTISKHCRIRVGPCWGCGSP